MKEFRTIRDFVLSAFFVSIALAPAGAQSPQDDKLPEKPIPADRSANSSVTETPWFKHPEVRKHLELDDDQYQKLEDDYKEARVRHDQKYQQVDPTMSEEERERFKDELRADFHKDVTKSTSSRIPREIMRQRYNQLYWQHRGVGGLNDSDVQTRLNLSTEQRQKLRKLERDWNGQVDGLQRNYVADPDSVLKRFNQGRAEVNEGIRSVLDEKQLKGWGEMTGKPYEFPPEIYFENRTEARPTLR